MSVHMGQRSKLSSQKSRDTVPLNYCPQELKYSFIKKIQSNEYPSVLQNYIEDENILSLNIWSIILSLNAKIS